MPSPHKKSFAAEQLALRQKNKVSPVVWVLVGVVVIALVFGGYVMYRRSVVQKQAETEAQQIKSVAVLPFDNLSDEKEDEYFSDGITDDIIFRLQQIKALKVISRTSSVLYRSSVKSLPEIGKELGVAAILEGTVRRVDNRVKITVQLINTQTDTHLWGNQYNRDLEDIFIVQGEIAQAVVDQLKVTLIGEEKEAIEKHPTENLEAYDLYLLGSHYTYFYEQDTALEYFEKAIQKDPDFALAYTGIAHVYNMLGYSGTMPPKESFPRAKEAIRTALELDENLAEAHTELVWTSLYYDWDWSTAEKSARRAIELNPNSWRAHHHYRDYLMIMGRWDEAIAEQQRAVELDPLNPITHLVAYTYYLAGRYDEGKKLCLELIESDPNNGNVHRILSGIYIAQGNYSEAVKEAEKTVELSSDNYSSANLARAYAISGERNKAEQILQWLLERPNEGYYPSARISIVYASLGEKDKAFEWLDKACESRESVVVYLKIFPEWETLRSDPRGKALLKKMGLE